MRIEQTVKAAGDMQESECANQPLRDPSSLESRQRRILRRRFHSVAEFKAAKLQTARRIAENPLKTHEALLKDHAPIPAAVRGKVGRSQSQWTLRRGSNG